MAGPALTKGSTLQCPHGGQVQPVPSQARAKAGDPILTSSDTFTISGCTFTLPSGTPSPCLSVTWLVADTRVKAGAATLSASSTGLCMNGQNVPQGPVTVVNTQQRVKTR
jgi:hypothetical protein